MEATRSPKQQQVKTAMQDQVEKPSVSGNRRAFIKGGGLAAGGAAIGLGLLAKALPHGPTR